MKFSTGFVVGAVVGGYALYNMTPQQREAVAQKADQAVQKFRNSSVVSSISTNVSGVAGAAGERVAEVVDSAGSTVAEKVGPNSSGDTPSGSSADASPNGKSVGISV